MNDNEELSFISLAAVTANVVRYLGLNEHQDEQGKHDGDRAHGDEEGAKGDGQRIDRRLRNGGA